MIYMIGIPKGLDITADQDPIIHAHEPLEIAQLQHGDIIPYEKLFPHEKYELAIEEVLTQDGDTATLLGSKSWAMIFGLLPEGEDLSDMDLYLQGPLEERELSQSSAPSHAQQIGKKESGEIRVDLISVERIKEATQEAFMDINKQIYDSIQDGTLEYTDPKTQSIFTNVRTSIRKLNSKITPEEVIAMNNLLLTDSVGIKLQKIQGEIQATLFDPLSALDQSGIFAPSIRRQLATVNEGRDLSGIGTDRINEGSYKETILHAIDLLGRVETTSKVPINAARQLFNLMKSGCYRTAELISQYRNPRTIGAHYALNSVAQKISRGLPITEISAKSGVFDVEIPEGTHSLSETEWLMRSAQTEFAISAEFDPILAITYMTIYFSLGGTISEGIREAFRDYHTTADFPPNTTLLSDLKHFSIYPDQLDAQNKELQRRIDFMRENIESPEISDDIRDEIRASIERNELPPQLREDIGELMTFEQMKKIYPTWRAIEQYNNSGKEIKAVEFLKRLTNIQTNLFPVEKAKLPKTNYRFVTNNAKAPQNMSEVIAFMAAALGWDPKEDVDKLQEIIDNWKVTGKSRNGFPFNLDLKKIQDTMKIYLENTE